MLYTTCQQDRGVLMGGVSSTASGMHLYVYFRIGHEGERGKLQGGQPFHQVACTRGYFNTGGYFNEEILFLACASLNTALLPEPITIALAPIYLPIIIARTYLSATGQ